MTKAPKAGVILIYRRSKITAYWELELSKKIYVIFKYKPHLHKRKFVLLIILASETNGENEF